MYRLIKISSLIILFLVYLSKPLQAEIIDKIKINGNQRVSNETIIMFSQVNVGQSLQQNDLNQILNNLYDTNFFSDVSIKFINNDLTINVIENPIIEKINYVGIKSNSLKEDLLNDLVLKSRSSFNRVTLQEDKRKLLSSLKNKGYYFAEIEIELIEKSDNKIDLTFNIDLGNKAKIKKINFIGNKIFKDNKLRSIIVSEEYKFWKIISGKKYLNEGIINFDERLLRNFYLNKGFYDVKINSSFARLVNNDEFELIFNIDAKEKFFFGSMDLNLPLDFDEQNFLDLKETLKNLKGNPYSIISVNEIINKLDEIATLEQYETIKATVNEDIIDNTINLTFEIEET